MLVLNSREGVAKGGMQILKRGKIDYFVEVVDCFLLFLHHQHPLFSQNLLLFFFAQADSELLSFDKLRLRNQLIAVCYISEYRRGLRSHCCYLRTNQCSFFWLF